MVREPIFKSTPLAELRPTQITVGMREVEAKRRHGAPNTATRPAHFSPAT